MSVSANISAVKIAIAVACLPLVAFFKLMELCPPGGTEETLLWIYPFYVLLAGYCAWKCVPDRNVLAWIIVVLLLLSHAAMWILVDPTLILPR